MLKFRDTKFLRLVFATFLTRAVSAIGNLIMIMAVAKFYGTFVLGQFSLGIAILAGGATVARFGADMSILKRGSIAWVEEDLARILGLQKQATFLTLSISFGLSISLIVFAESFAQILLKKIEMISVIRAVGIVLPAFPLMFLQSAWLKAVGLPQLSPLAEMGGAAFLTSILITSLHFAGIQLQGFELILLFGASIIVIYLCGVATWKRHLKTKFGIIERNAECSFDPQFRSSLLDFALPSMMTYFSNWGIIFLLGIFASYDEVASMTISLRLMLFIHIMSTVVMTVTAPLLGPLYARGRMRELKMTVQRATIFSIILGWPVALTMIFLPEVWATVIVDQKSYVIEILPILAAAQFVNVATGPAGLLLNMSGHEAIMRRIVLCVGALGLSGAIVFLPIYGVYAAAGTIAFIIVVQNVSATLLVKKCLGFFPALATSHKVGED